MKQFPSYKLLKPNNLFQYLFINKEVVQDLLSFVLTIHDKRNEININSNSLTVSNSDFILVCFACYFSSV